ncbi:MAG: putative transrane protein [Devosia sp.]|uniref:MFS transporter n=1 Tax=Devosia sp. TaxID=1871048 RepID=UPI00260DCE0E|nr:MFS transporter [Devosia sp.]MDB5539006.1 putative transrane protein [Devosia sp.]
MTPDSPHVLRLPSFLHFLSSRALSSVAFQGSAVAIGWLIYDRTRNPFDLGLVGLFQFLPMLILTFVAGQMADQFDRRRIGLVCQVVEAAVMGFIALGVWQGWLPTWGIFVAVAVLGAAQAFERPTMAALLPGIVPAAQLQSAVATSTSVMQTALIIGPAIGGVLYGLGPVAPFLVSGLLFLVASYNVLAIERPATLPARTPITFESVFAGVAFIKSKPVMLGTISLDLFAVLLGGATALLPVYARDILNAGPWGLGFLRMAPAVGAVAMSLVLARYPLQHRVGMKMLWAVGIFGAATIVFAYSTNIALSVLMLVILGASDTVSVVVRSSLVQLLTPDHMRGRVNAVNSLFIGTSNQLGEFESGIVAGLIGPVAAVAFGGIGTIAIVLIWARLFPALRRVDKLTG